MSRPSLAVAVFVFAVSSVAVVGAVGPAALGAATPVVGSTPGEPNHLAINDSAVAAHNTTSVGLDVSTAIVADSAALQSTYTETSFQRAMSNAESDANRTRIRRQALARVVNITHSLRERNRDAIRAYATGDISAGSFLRTQARIATRTNELRSVVTAIENSPPRPLSQDVTQRVLDAKAYIRALQGEISTTIGQQIASGGGGPAVYAEVSDSGYTLARILSNETYVRETFLGSEWQPQSRDRFATNSLNPRRAAENRSAAEYPWVIENNTGGGGIFSFAEVYNIGWVLPDGELEIYLSGSTTNVFRESQSRALLNFTTTETVNRTNESIRLTINRTYESGPTQVTLRDATTETPVNGTVAIGNRDPIYVGDDGTYWFVQPRGAVTVNATVDTTDISVTMDDA